MTDTRDGKKKTGKKRSGSGITLVRRALLFIIKHAVLFGLAFFTAGMLFMVTMDQVVMPFYQRSGKTVNLPDIRGKSIEEAESFLRARDLSIRVEKREYHTTVPENAVFLQIPSPGTPVKPGRAIRVRVSLGSQPLTAPDVVGMSPRNARLAIQDAGLTVSEERWIPSNDYPNGIVAAQDPPAGSETPANEGILLLISNGRRVTDVIMPNLINLSLPAARDSLLSHGFNLALLRVQREAQPDLLPDTVIEQFPDPSRPANTNEEVILVVSSPAERTPEE